MSNRIYVADVDEIEHDERKTVETRVGEIGVVNYDGEFFAIHGTCPHQGGPVCTGLVRGKLVAEWDTPGERVTEDVDRDSPTVSCPWHGWEFDLESGCHVGESDVKVPTYDIVVDDGEIYVEL